MKCHEMMGRHMSQEYPPRQTVQTRSEGREDTDPGRLGEEHKTPAMAVTT